MAKPTSGLILQNSQNFSPYYQGELYNHLPMALWALDKMGATSERIEAFYKDNLSILNPLVYADIKITHDNFNEHFGVLNSYAAYAEFFRNEIASLGVEKTLTKYIGRLMPGVSGAAFHSLIRLSYGYEMGSHEEIAQSLATWVTSYLDLGSETKFKAHVSFSDLFEDFQKLDLSSIKGIRGNNIAERVKALRDSPLFKNVWPLLNVKELEDSKLEKSLVWLFSQSNDFTILHTVTSHHAFMMLSPFIDDIANARVHFWKGVWAAYLSTGPKAIRTDWKFPTSPLPDWNEILKLAVQSDDDHVIKLVYTCLQKFQRNPDLTFTFAAARKLKLVS